MLLPSRLRRAAALGTASLLSLGILATPTLSAGPANGEDEWRGDDWSITDLGGAYEIVLDLARPLPVRDDAPTLVVDGVVVGLAQESEDGRSLTVVTGDASVAGATSVEPGWSSQPTEAEDPSLEGKSPEDLVSDPTLTLDGAATDTPDPAVHGEYAYTKSVYRFGDQSIDLAGIGGIRGEVEGKIYLPTTGGARPVVLFLHGRHASCNGPNPNPLRWPCGPEQTIIPSYAGYDGAAEALASNGYAVISISANSVNANDNQLALDQGAKARGQLILDTLGLFRKANAGEPVSLHDDATDQDVTLADALSGNGGTQAATIDPEVVEITPADLVGRLDYSAIGLMGHSRGGEGVTSAATLNNALATPFDIRAILPLAPVDFGRMTTPNVPTMVLLPYCDGDVSNQQGQHMNDDSRYAFDDDVLRSNVWVMGANHNFFNTVWTPSLYALSSSDDWSGTSTTSARATDSVCGTAGTAVDTTIRLTPEDQYDVGTSLLAGFFRMGVGGEDEFLPMFDGSGAKVTTTEEADIRVTATQPAGSRADLATFTSPNPRVRTYGTATATLCASLSGRTLPPVLPYCATTLASAQAPHWTPASNGANVPASPMTRMVWTTETGEVRVGIPAPQRDASAYQNLSVKLAADESVAVGAGTDLTITVIDGTGATFAKKVSELNPNALVRLPQSTQNPTTLGKVVLQQVNLPIAEMTGVDTSDLREVRITAAVGTDGLITGGAYLSDLAFDTPSVGTAVVENELTVDTMPVRVEERAGPDEVFVPVVLSAPADQPVTAHLTVGGSTASTSKVGVAMEPVTFAPGEVCKTVSVATYGDTAASTAPSTSFKISVTNTSNAVMGDDAFASLVVREDDGVTGADPALPPVGVPGDVCAEYAALTAPGELTLSDPTPAPGEPTTISGTGYRPGESVAFTLGEVSLGSAITGPDGTVALAAVVPADTPVGAGEVSAVGAGSAYPSIAEVTVLTTTSTSLSMSPEAPAIKQAVTLSATVAGAASAGEVEFFDGATSLGTSPVTAGEATLALPGGFLAGSHELTAVFGGTSEADTSASDVLSLTLTKGQSTIALLLAADAVAYGSPVTGRVAVSGGAAGDVEVTYGSTVLLVPVTGGVGSFSIPAGLAVGSYDVAATFLGTDELEASGTATAELTVARKATTTAVAAPAKVKPGKRFTVRVTLMGGVVGTFPTGPVRVYRRSGSGGFTPAGSATATAVARGRLSFSLRAPAKAGRLRVKVVYAGDASYAGSTSTVEAVHITR